ncbi:hypothetical protein EMIHUDRAFT_233353 [Emiliania huxleyi CCMP1516]|uniref:Uncharacterized protein n=2 Tax=Emiliania huxleyi TaxID=2903 RepID=A0A0D3K2G7_EMIH1|nr:hypothetical protein EMIHUDRAFT_233353 [Emiliania huxleyi CCMP1516]EOD29952.1 hypothetical protein EMIHUDRAFT_233353 [Emiliania huxleyi CCMP1516]|eukprot:XP_005782381.1 hypothetical protein EMIHUDRAFT_233353 [Emiliania huxleyi CCMP1516]
MKKTRELNFIFFSAVSVESRRVALATIATPSRADAPRRRPVAAVRHATAGHDKQADLGRSGARDCGAPEWQDESIPTDADDGESSTVGDDMPINGGDNRGLRRERAIEIDLDPADSTDVDVITSAATALSLDDTVENRTEDLAEAMGRITFWTPTPPW